MIAALANAAGTTIGAAVLIALIERNGVESVTDAFPSIFASKTWERSKELIHTYGFPGVVAVSAMPIVLHPAVIFAITAGMNRATLIAAVMLGRTIKYTLMAQLAVGAPQLLRFFGHKGEVAAGGSDGASAGSSGTAGAKPAKPRSRKVD
jgi:membrane protein YqaA with SNARE-associated domain